MMRLGCVTTLLVTLSIIGMDKQIELSNRGAYMKKIQNQAQNVIQTNMPKICAFCDPEVLAQNKIVEKDEKTNTMVMMNLHVYFQQGFHVMTMPISHIEQPLDFFPYRLNCMIGQVAAMLKFNKIFHSKAFIQENVTSWGPSAGQSQPHWHTHMKAYLQASCSLDERVCYDQNITKNDEDYKFDAIKSLWNSDQSLISIETSTYVCKCHSCNMIKTATNDEKNFVIGRFKHNLVCLTNKPNLSVQVHVIPFRHINTLKNLLLEEAHENIALATALLSKVRAFAHEHISGGCDGANWLTTSISEKASNVQHKEYPHLQTIVIPRPNMPLSPGTLVGMTCKLDFNPREFMIHMKNFKNEFQELIQS